MYFISISTCNWNDITTVISFWLADSTHFKFKKLKVKTAEEFAFNIKKTVLRTKFGVLCCI